ncbi:hypothetical protein CDAR_583091 [Caerostris darwini]|uniref:Uncharacterized protein n=1 Tax=Caerostris darwini TaxID=1538125 RepID=A0AAV4P9Q2_9ARAC|nr:hypothetical protein CDAR_583091 [Caerostris darwini]
MNDAEVSRSGIAFPIRPGTGSPVGTAFPAVKTLLTVESREERTEHHNTQRRDFLGTISMLTAAGIACRQTLSRLLLGKPISHAVL